MNKFDYIFNNNILDVIADIYRVSKESYYLGELYRRIRKYSSRLSALNQRPQEVDKSIFN